MQTLTPDETILGLLAQQPRHGYDLVQTLADPQALGRVWQLSTSQVYAVLNRLKEQGCIQGEKVTTATAPPRTVYAITAAGRARLEAWLFAPTPSASIRRVRVEFLSRLHVARQLDLPMAEIIDQQRQSCARRRAEVQASRRQVRGATAVLALDLVLAQLQAVLAWIDHCATAAEQET